MHQMQPQPAFARYEIITRHALALAGVLGVEIHLRDSEGGPLRLVASSIAPPALSAIGHEHGPNPGEARRGTLLDAEALAPFFDLVLSEPGLQHTNIMPTPNGRFAERRDEAVNGRALAHLVAGRVEARGTVMGLMAFTLDRPPGAAGGEALEGFIREAGRAVTSRMAGRDTSAARAAHRLESVLQLAQTTLLSGDMPSTLQAVIDKLRELFDADLAVILLLDEADGALKAAADSSSDLGISMIHERAQDTPPRDIGLTGWVVRNMRPALIADSAEDGRPEARRRSEPESMVAAPLVGNGRLIGVLRVGAIGQNRFGADDLRLVEAVASQVVVVVEAARLRDELRQQNESLAMMARLVEASRDAILLVDPLGRIAHCNPAMESLFGYGKAELVGRSVVNLRSDRNTAGLNQTVEETLIELGDWEGEIRERRKDRSEFPAEVRISAVFDDNGERIGFVEIIRDLTRRKAWEAERVQSEKLRSLGVMAAGVAHEVNNSLAGVLGQADLMLRMTHEPQARRCLEAIINAAEDGAGSVRRITEFARPSSDNEFAPVDLCEVVREVVRATAPRWRDHAARHGRTIRAEVAASGSVWALGSVTELREALTNLVLNAVDALPSDGSIRIEVKEANGRAIVAVTDTGTGMTDEVRQRIFDPFFTTKPFGQGTGLGLALVYGIVERHHGEIHVLSQLGEGTTFEIELEIAEAPVREEAELPGDSTTHPLRILVVEDEEVLGEQLRTILSLDGHSIRLCSSGQEALDALYEPYDLLITDLGMPGIGGKEVATAAKARFPNMPVGLVTGWTGDLIDLSDLGERGVDFVVPKPYRIQAIREAVAKACAAPVLTR